MTRLLFAPGLLIAIGAALSAAPVPVTPPDPTKDRDGNPMPPGVVARLGSLSLRASVSPLSFTADGKQLRSIRGWEYFSYDAGTGRVLSISRPMKDGYEPYSTLAGDRIFTIERISLPPAPGQPARGTGVSVRNLEGKEICFIPCKNQLYFATSSSLPLPASFEASRDGRTIAIVSQVNKQLEVYDADTGKQLHTQPITPQKGGSIISPDGKILYICDRTKPIRRCELISGKALPDLDGTDQYTEHLAVSVDGKRVVTRSDFVEKKPNGFVVRGRPTFLTVHDAEANKTLGKLDTGESPEHFAFVGEESVIVLARHGTFPPDYTLQRWNIKTLKREWTTPMPPQRHTFSWLAISPDGKKIAVTNLYGITSLYNAETGKLFIEPSSHSGPVSWVKFSDTGESVATAAEDGIRTWTLKGEPKGVAKLPEITRSRMPAELIGEHLVWISDSEDKKKTELIGWNPEKNEIGWRFALDGPAPNRILSHDGKRCVTITEDRAKRACNIVVYDGPAGKKLHDWTLDLANPNGGAFNWPPMAISPNGEVLFVAGDGIGAAEGISLRDITTGKEKAHIDAGKCISATGVSAFSLGVSADGTKVAVVQRGQKISNALVVLDVKSGKKLAEHRLVYTHSPIIRFSPNGKRVAVCEMVGGSSVSVFDTESSETPPRKVLFNYDRIHCIAFNPSGPHLAIVCSNGTTMLLDMSAK